MKPIRSVSTLLLVAAALLPAACGAAADPASTTTPRATAAGAAGDRPLVVVTYPVLGSVVREIIGEAGEVKVLMPNGSDPHQWSPSARDIQVMMGADLIIDNGLELEGKLQDPLREAKAQRIPVYPVGEHITVRKVKAGEGAEADDPDQAPGADDPHLWMDPLTMRQWVGPLVPVLRGVGIEAAAGATKVEAELAALNTQVAAVLDTVPADRRKLVTGHESLGYLAERYRYQLIGAIVPAVTSQAEASAGDLAQLEKKIKAARVPAVFAEIGTPKATVEAVGRDTGAKVVELSTHNLPSDGSYRTFMLDIANAIAGALR